MADCSLGGVDTTGHASGGKSERDLGGFAERAAQQLDHARDQRIRLDAGGLQRLLRAKAAAAASDRRPARPRRAIRLTISPIASMSIPSIADGASSRLPNDDAEQIVEIVR